MASNSEESETQFAKYLGMMSNMCFVAHGVGLGEQLGIFQLMADVDKPLTCEELSAKGGWKTRYIKEWLALMACGKIVDYDETNKTYYLPKHRCPSLLPSGKIKNIGGFIRGINITTRVDQELSSCFPLNGPTGIPYSSYPGFHEWREIRTSTQYEINNISDILCQIPNLIDRLENGISVVDGGCSSGHQVMLLAERFPKSTFIGFDIDDDVVVTANTAAKEKGLTNISFQAQDACSMPKSWCQNFDLVMVWDVVHDLAYPKEFLNGITEILKPGGIFFMNDIYMNSDLSKNLDVGHSPAMYGFSLYHCMPVSLYFKDGRGLGACWGIEMQREFLKEAGFKNIRELQGHVKNQSFISAEK